MKSRTMLAVLLVSMSLCICASGAEKSPPIPSVEIEKAKDYLRRWFGDEAFENTLKYNSSGLIGSEDSVDGYYVCYLFCPRNTAASGSHALMCVSRLVDEDFSFMGGGAPPDCAEDPGLCEVLVRNTEAVQIAQDNGFAAPLRDTAVSLRWSADLQHFVWEVQDAAFLDNEWDRESIEDRTFLVDARSGELLRIH